MEMEKGLRERLSEETERKWKKVSKKESEMKMTLVYVCNGQGKLESAHLGYPKKQSLQNNHNITLFPAPPRPPTTAMDAGAAIPVVSQPLFLDLH